MLFAAVHESVIGTKLTIAALQQFGRYWTNNGQREAPGLNGSAANDPMGTTVFAIIAKPILQGTCPMSCDTP